MNQTPSMFSGSVKSTQEIIYFILSLMLYDEKRRIIPHTFHSIRLHGISINIVQHDKHARPRFCRCNDEKERALIQR